MNYFPYQAYIKYFVHNLGYTLNKLSSDSEYAEYVVVTNTGNSYVYCMSMEDRDEGYPLVYDKKLYMGYNYYTSGGYIKRYTVGGQNATRTYPQIYSGGTKSRGMMEMHVTTELTADSGYLSMAESENKINVACAEYCKIPQSNNLYMQYIPIQNEGGYYNIKVNVYQLVNGFMHFIRFGMITINNSYIPSFSVYDSGEQISVTNQAVPALLLDDYGAVLSDGTIVDYMKKLQDTKYYSFHMTKYNGRLAIIRNKSASSTYFRWSDENGTLCYWQKINYLNYSSSGEFVIGDDIDLKIQSSGYEGLDGYYSSYSTFVSPKTITLATTVSTNDWFKRELTNVFPDGRYVECYWNGDGYNSCEIWYSIFDADGTQTSTGPTGYVRYFNNLADDTIYKKLMPIAVNDSKFVVCMQTFKHSFMNEYYRSGVSYEKPDGEIEIGGMRESKKLSQFEDSDTEPVQIDIDLAKDELPIGFDIKDNVINDEKLDSNLREQINTIRLNDIVIIAKSEFASGSNNTGAYLGSFSEYDFSMGDSFVSFYTNGQNFNWYCYYPDQLKPGVYDKVFWTQDKTIYVTVKVIEPPKMDGIVSVVF